MQSIKYVPASNGAANVSLMTVQGVRAALASDITVNTVSGAPAYFYATMGTPHTFTDPVTSETITVISDATAVDFAGHLNSGKVTIDAIAPGYTDTGSKVGDIVIIRPVTEWANNVFNILNQSMNDDGTLKNSAITYNPNIFDYVVSGGAIAGLAYGSTLTASISAGTCYITSILQTIGAVATRTYTASKDTYVDALYSSTGTATIVYTEVANNAAAPALAASSIRLGKVITGASSISSATSILQVGIDSLKNLIYPRKAGTKLAADANGWTAKYTGQAIVYEQAFAWNNGIIGHQSNGLVASAVLMPVGIIDTSYIRAQCTWLGGYGGRLVASLDNGGTLSAVTSFGVQIGNLLATDITTSGYVYVQFTTV